MNSQVFSHKRALSLIAGNAIGTGIFTTTGFALRDLLSPWLVLSLWVLGGVYALLGVYSYSILHSRFPGSGGEYHFIRKGIHPRAGLPVGLITILIGFTAPLAASAMAFAVYFQRVLPLSLNTTLISFLALTFVYLVLVSSLHKGMRWHDSFIYLKLFLFMVLILISFYVAKWQWPSQWFLNLKDSTDSSSSFNIYTYAKSFFWIAYAYSGWNAVYYIASELTNDGRKILSASFIGTGLVIVLYVLINIPLLFGMPSKNLSGAPEVMAVFFSNTTGFSVEKIISAVIALGLLSTLSSFLIIVPRIYSRMSEDKALPSFFYFEAGTHPYRALSFQYVLTSIFLLLFNFEFILNTAGFVITLCSLLSVMSLYFSKKIHLNSIQIIGTSAYILLTSLLVYFGGPWF